MGKKEVVLKPNWFDNTIGFFSPAAKARRLQAKYQSYFLENVARKYDGASKGRRTSGWRAPTTSANAETELSLHTLRNRSRDLRRNSAYISRAVQVITANTIGKGIRVQFNGRNDRQTQRIRELWNQWAMTQNIDFEGRMDLNSIQDLAMDAIVESGEILIRRRRVKPTESNPFPVQLQMLESDFINDALSSIFITENGNTVLQGIEFDENGRRVSYKIYKEHPGSAYLKLDGSTFDYVTINAEDMIHAFRADRPGQIRGVPWAAPVMINIKDLEDYEDTQLVRQKIAACFTAFVIDQETGNGLSQTEVDELERFEPGMIEKLSAGKQVVMANPPTVENYKEYITTMLHKIATGMGISYESLTGDLSEVNFSSARMGWLEMSRNIKKWQDQIMISQVLKPVVNYFFEALDLLGVDRRGVEVSFIPPAREMIDPGKEVQAKVKEIRSGLSTLTEALLERGKDPDEHFRQMARDNQVIDQNDFTLDSDPRKVSQSGIHQQDESTSSIDD